MDRHVERRRNIRRERGKRKDIMKLREEGIQIARICSVTADIRRRLGFQARGMDIVRSQVGSENTQTISSSAFQPIRVLVMGTGWARHGVAIVTGGLCKVSW